MVYAFAKRHYIAMCYVVKLFGMLYALTDAVSLKARSTAESLRNRLFYDMPDK